MSTTDLTGDDMFNSLTGFDEIAIASHFGMRVAKLHPDNEETGDSFEFIRALIFVHKRRSGSPDAEAFKAAMEVPMTELLDYFDQGKDEDDAGKEPSA